MRIAALIVAATCWLGACTTAPESFDLVLKSGRVIDPETNLDAVRDVGIRGDTIARISSDPLTGRRTIDARGLVVTPGFIELHQHGHRQDDYRLPALDGVTAALELEAGVPDVQRFIDARRGQSLIHFGAAASHLTARLLAWDAPLPTSAFGPDAGIIPQSSPATNEPASRERLDRIVATLRSQIEAGALGVGMGLEYAPGATRDEVTEVFQLAQRIGGPVFVHVRKSGAGVGVEAITEVLDAAAASGAALHIVHVNSSCMRASQECLSLVARARDNGVDVTTEAYPYTAGSTAINSAYFNPGWREQRGIDFGDLELPETGERLTRERFDVLHAAPEPPAFRARERCQQERTDRIQPCELRREAPARRMARGTAEAVFVLGLLASSPCQMPGQELSNPLNPDSHEAPRESRCWSPVTTVSEPAATAHSRIRLSVSREERHRALQRG